MYSPHSCLLCSNFKTLKMMFPLFDWLPCTTLKCVPRKHAIGQFRVLTRLQRRSSVNFLPPSEPTRVGSGHYLLAWSSRYCWSEPEPGRTGTMSRLPVCLLALLFLLGTLHIVEAKYANGKRRSGHRLTSDASPPLKQHQVGSVKQCLNLCDSLADCVALNFGSVSATKNCQLLGQRACSGLPLVADASVDYYDVYEPQNLTAETQTPFWDDPSCKEDGYCAADCAAEEAGEFCTVDAHCSAKLKPPDGYQCVEGACQPSSDFWELRTGLALPRWQLWRADWHVWTWKKLKPGTCSLDIRVKLGVGAVVSISPTWIDDHVGTRMVFQFSTSSTNLYYHDESGTAHYLVQGASTSGMVNTEEFSQLKMSWCGGAMAIGPENNPTLVTGQATITQPVDFVMVWSQNTASWISVNSGVADRWLFDDSGVTPDAVMDIGPHTYAYRSITPTNDVTVKYDCMADRDCLVTLQGESSSPRMLAICVGCYANQESALAYRGGVDGDLLRFVTGPVLSSAEFNTFTVRYNNGYVTVYRNDAKIPIYAVDVPHPITNINIIGIGGCCGHKYVRAARYDPGWRTDTWMTEGSGYSASDVLT